MICGRPSKEFLSAGLPGSSESAVKVDVPEALLSPSFQFQALTTDKHLVGTFKNLEMNTDMKSSSFNSHPNFNSTAMPNYRYAKGAIARPRLFFNRARRKTPSTNLIHQPS